MFLMSLVHEETAMVGGGYLITEEGLPALPVVLVLTAGVMCGDWGVYGLGVIARRVPAKRAAVASMTVAGGLVLSWMAASWLCRAW